MTPIRLRWDGEALASAAGDVLGARGAGGAVDPALESAVRDVVADVRGRGDVALRERAARYDGVALDSLEVPRERCEAALDSLPSELRAALDRAARNLRTAHAAFAPQALEAETEPGVIVGRRPDPLARVGVYAPGGRAAYPSSALMACVPAAVAGVREVIVCSPPQRESSAPSPLVLAAAALGGATRVFALGGAGAVAAMAFGTASVPAVQRIVGPGNAWVAEAKRQVAGIVGIDSPAGPSELLVVADGSADPQRVARELVAQAEHDPDAAALAIAIGERIGREIATALRAAAAGAERRAIVEAALAMRGGVLCATSREEALAFANRYAAEHLLLAVRDAEAALADVRETGAVFVGEASSACFGDYLAGGNHVLPTAGFARAASGLSTLDFVRWTAWQRVTPAGAAALAADCATLARAEDLPAHAAAAAAWTAAPGCSRGAEVAR
jgi:histidinol dehydrogenase